MRLLLSPRHEIIPYQGLKFLRWASGSSKAIKRKKSLAHIVEICQCGIRRQSTAEKRRERPGIAFLMALQREDTIAGSRDSIISAISTSHRSLPFFLPLQGKEPRELLEMKLISGGGI